MSKGLLKIEVYTDTDFKNASTLERFALHMQEPDRFELTDSEDKHLELLRQAFAILCKDDTYGSAAKKIKKIDPYISDRRSIKIINEARALFGDSIKTNRTADRFFRIERLKAVIKKMEKILNSKFEETADKIEAAKVIERCQRTIGTFQGVHIHDASAIDPDTIKLPSVRFTTSPKALANPEIEDAEIDEN